MEDAPPIKLAKDARPVAEKIFNAINDATPAIKSAAEWIGNLAQKLPNFHLNSKKLCRKWPLCAAAAGPVLSVTSKLTTTIGGATEGIGQVHTKTCREKSGQKKLQSWQQKDYLHPALKFKLQLY